jgi:hypothetical protein
VRPPRLCGYTGFLTRSFAAAAICLFSAGCGYIGGTLPPLANIPVNPAGLAVVQRGSNLFAHFTLPQLTTESVAIKGDLELDLRAGVTPDPWSEGAWAAQAMKISPQVVKDGVAQYQFPSGQWTGKQITVAARVAGPNGKPSNWSNFATVPVVSPLPAPSDLAAAATAKGVRLEWRGAGGHFRILRRSEGQPEFAEIGASTTPEFVDGGAEFGKKYSYIVQAFEDLGENREAQSELSQETTLTPIDTFATATPAGLRATSSAATVELSWDANSETDLAGYRVYRSADGGAFQKIADVGEIPTYSDRAVEHGKTYRYAVTAIDKSGNESDRSTVAEATL